MYSVSLLPNEYRMLHKQIRKKEYTYILSITLLIVLLLVYLCLSFILKNKVYELEMEQNQIESLEKSINNMIEIETLKNKVDSMQEQLLQASGNNPRWDNILSVIGNSVPETVGISSMNINFNGQYGEILIHGTANNNSSISEWISKLEELAVVDQTRFNFSSADEKGEHLQFELTMIIPSGSVEMGGVFK